MQLLEVHHKNNEHHDNEHSKLKDMEGRSDDGNAVPTTTFKALADLKAMLALGQGNAR